MECEQNGGMSKRYGLAEAVAEPVGMNVGKQLRRELKVKSWKRVGQSWETGIKGFYVGFLVGTQAGAVLVGFVRKCVAIALIPLHNQNNERTS